MVQSKYGHKLMLLASDALAEFKLNPMRLDLSTEVPRRSTVLKMARAAPR